MITNDVNINKINYLGIIKFLSRDRDKLIDTLLSMEKNNEKKRNIKSSWCGHYCIMKFDNGILAYTMINDYCLGLWPIEFIINKTGNNKVIFIKKHAILRYQERFLGNGTIEFNDVLQEFLLSLFLDEKKNKYIIKKEKNLDSVSLRIRDGALLGYCYMASPNIIRFNTFISDKEIEGAKRNDQKILLREE